MDLLEVAREGEMFIERSSRRRLQMKELNKAIRARKAQRSFCFKFSISKDGNFVNLRQRKRRAMPESLMTSGQKRGCESTKSSNKGAEQWPTCTIGDFGVNAEAQCCLREYIDSIAASELEKMSWTKNNGIFPSSPEITPWIRSLLVDWMIDVAFKSSIGIHALIAAVGIIDEMASKSAVKRSRYQTLGIAALIIALKFEEKREARSKTFARIFEPQFSVANILAEEATILNLLDYKLVRTSALFQAELAIYRVGLPWGDQLKTALHSFVLIHLLQPIPITIDENFLAISLLNAAILLIKEDNTELLNIFQKNAEIKNCTHMLYNAAIDAKKAGWKSLRNTIFFEANDLAFFSESWV